MIKENLEKKITNLEKELAEYRRKEARLSRNELELSIILEGVPSFVLLLDRGLRVCRANRATLEFSERSEKDIKEMLFGKALHCVHHLEELKGCTNGDFCGDCILLKAIKETFQTGKGYHRFETCLHLRADEIPARTFLLTTSFMSFGEEERVLVCLEDVTDLKIAEEVLKAEKERFKSITSAAQDAIIMIDDQGIIRYWNEAAERIFNYEKQEALNQDIHDLIISPERQIDLQDSLLELRDEGRCHVLGKTTELVAMKKGGKELPIELSLSTVMLEKRWHAVGIVRDITKRKKMEKELEKLATTDQLTGIYNRRKLLEWLEYERGVAKRFGRDLCLIMFDIDYFKNINDRYGHKVGDEVLKTLVQVVQRSIREVDVLARWGGEEFVILTPDTGLKGAVYLAEKLRGIIAATEFPQIGHITISFGVAQDRPEEAIDFFISRVDDFMYRAKTRGRNQVQSEYNL